MKNFSIKNNYTNFPFLTIIIVGIILRLILAFLPGFRIDTNAWYAWAERLNQVGFSEFYSDQVWTNYTPGYLYILYLLDFIKNILNLDTNSFYYILKLPSIFAEIIIGILVFRWIFRHNLTKFSNLVLLLVLFTPVFIFNSSIWGQIDGLLTLFIFLSVYFLQKKKFIYSSIFLGIAFLIKPQAISIFPLYILILSKHFSIKNLVKISIPAILTIFILSWPFFPTQPIIGPYQLFYKMVADYPYNSLFAYNFWGIFGFWISDSTLFKNISYKEWGIILLGFFWLITTLLYLKRKLTIYSLAALSCLAFYFLPNHVHERYLYPALLFLLLVAWELKSRLLLILTTFLSFIHLANIYYVYVYYNELYLKLPNTLYLAPVYDLLNQNDKTLSFISTLFFVIIIILVFKLNYAKHPD